MSPRAPRINAAKLLQALKRDGWEQVRQSGSHVTLKHPIKTTSVTVPKHAQVIIKPKTLEAILKQADLTTDDLRRLL
jgi:predicted RNA binding protein YcfA (HicA-like mRNA interferase family)